MIENLVDISPEEEGRIVAAVQAILDAGNWSFKITGITAKSVGVMGDARTREWGLVVTPNTIEACDTGVQQLLSTKIVNEVTGVNRITFEIPLTF